MIDYKNMISRITRATKILFCGCMVTLTCSCEDFLTISPTDKIVDFWKTKTDVENVAAESYRLMSQWDFLSRVLVWGELRGDNVVEGNYGGNTDIMNIIEANLLPTNGYASWAPFYKVINNCNIVLANAAGVMDEDPEFTMGDYEVIAGEMYALRALCHFYLVRTFRDIPLLDYAVEDDGQNLYQKQEDPIVVLDACIKDLRLAEELVLASGNYAGDNEKEKNKGRITKDAVRAIMADVLLWKAAFMAQKAGGDQFVSDAANVQECYSECIRYCDLVLEARMNYFKKNSKENDDLEKVLNRTTTKSVFPFPILFARDADLKNLSARLNSNGGFAPYLHLFGKSDAALDESIFEIYHTTEDKNGNYEVPYFYGYAANNDFKMGMVSASKYLSVASAGVTDNKKLYAKSDFRRVNYIRSESGESNVDKYPIVKYGYSSTGEDRSKLNATDSDDQKKFGKVTYTFWKTNPAGGKHYFSDAQVNWIVYRISDVMLMKAEALSLMTGGDLALAFQLVDAVYTRSQSSHIYGEGENILIFPDLADRLNKDNYTNQRAMYELVLKERQREFAFEGKRWYDLVRVALHDNSTQRILDIISNAGNNPEYFKEYRMTMSTLHSLFFPIAQREIDASDDDSDDIDGPILNQNPVYETKSDISDNDDKRK